VFIPSLDHRTGRHTLLKTRTRLERIGCVYSALVISWECDIFHYGDDCSAALLRVCYPRVALEREGLLIMGRDSGVQWKQEAATNRCMKQMHFARLTLTSRVDERPRNWENRRLAPADPGAPSLKDPEQVSKE
jgi:hypothetical protein